MEREEWEILMGLLTPGQRSFVDLSHQELSNQDMAELLDLSPGRVSQMRREIQRLYNR
jgi:DNA-directed RNA polymerase specialized sigma24 family protein